MKLPYPEILTKGLRQYSLALLARLKAPELSKEEQREVRRCLCALSDPRTLGPLREILLNPQKEDELRALAGKILRDLDYGPEEDEAQLRAWWTSHDPILQEHALCSMGRLCPDIVEEVAKDPEHPFYQEAILAMRHYFSMPTHQQLKISALSHRDQGVREDAAYVLLWDEPVIAETALLQASYDPEPDVVLQVCRTLEYYPTHAVMRRLIELTNSKNPQIQKEAAASLECIKGTCLSALTHKDPKRRAHIRRWLSPVWELLSFSEDELSPEEETPASSAPRPQEQKAQATFAVIRPPLQNPDAPVEALQHLFREIDWASFPEEERALLKALLSQSPDLFVRQHLPNILHQWGDQAGLVALLDDPDFVVRKSATYSLGETKPYQKEIGELLWERFLGVSRLSVHASETLRASMLHLPKEKAIPHLLQLAKDTAQRENIRYDAVYGLKRLQARSEILELSYLLTEVPLVTWALHISLLESFVELGLPAPDIGWLFSVDNLDLQIALSPFALLE